MRIQPVDLKTLNLSYENIYTVDWSILLRRAQTSLDRKTGMTMASFDLPIEGMEDPKPVYDSAMRFGRTWMKWMLEHHPLEIGELMIQHTLRSTVQEIEERSIDRWIEVQNQLAKADPELTEELKSTDQMRWVGIMNNIRAQALEIVVSELAPTVEE